MKNDGKLSKVSAIDQSGTMDSSYGPEKYVVEYKYDDAGRMVRKVVMDNPKDPSAARTESDYTYDGMGRLTRERTWRYDSTTEMMIVTQDKITSYDLGGNPTEIKYYDNLGWVYTETRTYAKGFQITNAILNARGGVTANTSGSFTYDTNNNMLTSKGVTIFEGTTQYAFRENWTFEFDRKNRMINFTHANTDDKRWLWYDGRGRVWQRWTYDTNTTYWAETLNRYVYDGGTLAQEHVINSADVENEWVYTYLDLTYDYLRKPGGIRQIERDDQGDDTYQFLIQEGGTPTARIKSETQSDVQRMELTASGERQATGSTQDTQISNIGPGGGYIESYASTVGQTEYFDPLVKRGGRHFLPSINRYTNRKGNNAYTDKASEENFDECEYFKYMFTGGRYQDYTWEDWKDELGQICGGIFTCLGPLGGVGRFYNCGTVAIADVALAIPIVIEESPPPEEEEPPEMYIGPKLECCCMEDFERSSDYSNWNYRSNQSVFSVAGCTCTYECHEKGYEENVWTHITEPCPEDNGTPHNVPEDCCDCYINHYYVKENLAHIHLLNWTGTPHYWYNYTSCKELCKAALSSSEFISRDYSLYQYYVNCTSRSECIRECSLLPCRMHD